MPFPVIAAWVGGTLLTAAGVTLVVSLVDNINDALMEKDIHRAHYLIDRIEAEDQCALAALYNDHYHQMSAETRALFEDRLGRSGRTSSCI